jgi:hypothetical protein
MNKMSIKITNVGVEWLKEGTTIAIFFSFKWLWGAIGTTSALGRMFKTLTRKNVGKQRMIGTMPSTSKNVNRGW